MPQCPGPPLLMTGLVPPAVGALRTPDAFPGARKIFTSDSHSMFKRFRTAKEEAKRSKFKEPKVRKCKEVHTHTKEHTQIDKIFLLASLPKKRKTMYRMVMELPPPELDRNIYILANVLLNALLEDSAIDKLFYSALGRLLRSPKAHAIKGICIDYLIAQLSIDRKYLSYAEYLIRNHSNVIADRKNEVAQHTLDEGLKRRVLSLREPKGTKLFDAADCIYFTR